MRHRILLSIGAMVLASSTLFAQFTGGSGGGYAGTAAAAGWASPSTSTITASSPSITANGISTTLLTVQLKDAAGTNLSAGGDSLSFTTTTGSLGAVTDNGDGTFKVTLTSSTTVGTDTVKVWIDGQPMTNRATVQFTISVPKTMTLKGGNNQTKTVLSLLDSSFVVVLKDSNGIVAPNASVLFTVTSRPSGATGDSLTVTNATANANGEASTVLKLGNKSGTYQVQASASGVTGSPVTFTATATPGSFSLSQSTVSVGRTSIASGDTTLVTLIARDANGNRLTGGGLTVAFGLGAGTSSGTYGTVADSANGKYTSVFTGTTSGTARSLTAKINTLSVTSTMPSVTVTPGSFSLSQSTVSVGRTSIASGDTTLVTLIARDANGNRLTGGGLTVAFGLGAGTSSGTYGTVADSANGKYTSVFTGTTSGTARTLTATINSSTVTSTMPSVTVTPGSFSLSQSTVSVGRTSIASGDTTLVTLIARDANGNRLTGGGLTVAFGLGSGTSSGSFSTVADSSNGKYTSVFTGTASGTARTLTATINSSTVTSTMPSVTVTPGSFSLSQSTVSVGRTSIASGDTTLVTLIARDANGNRLTGGGLTVAFGLGAGTSSGTYGTVADSANGKYTSVFTGTTSGTARTLSATINSSTVTSTMPSVTVTPGSFSLSQSTVSVGRTSIASGDTTLVTLIARDANGNRLTGGGLTVAFGLGSGTSSGSFSTVADSSNGKYTSVFTGTTSGTARSLTAKINTLSVTSTMPSVTVTPGSFSLSQSTVSVGRTSIASGDTTLVTLIARDANGNRLTGGGLTVAFGLGSGTSSGSFSTVADSANGKYTSVFTGTASGTARTLSATINSSTVTSTMPSVTVTPGSFSLSQSTVSVGRTSIASGDTTLVTLIARDANGNRLTGGGLTVAFGLGAGTSSGTYGTVADSSNGKYTSVFTGTASGTARTLSATINSSTVTSTMPSVTVTPGSFSLSQSTVSVGRTSIASGDTTLVTLIARDANGNRLTGGGLTVAFGLGSGTSSGSFWTVADSSNGKYTSVFTGTASGTARTLSATINSSTVTSTMPSVTVTPGSFSLSQSTVSVGRTSIASGDTTLVTLIARDANGNRLTGGGLTVAFGLGAGTSSGTYGTVADSANGKYTSVFTGTASGTARTLSATINSSTVTSTMPSVTVTPGSFSLSQSTVSVGRTSIASGDTTLVTLIARDANGNRLTGGGLTVAFGLGAGTSSGTYGTVADSANGKYTSVFTGTASGTARTLSATINSSTVTSTMPSVTVTPGSFSLSQSTVSVGRTSIASGDTTLVTLIARDANGNRLTGGGLTVAFGLGAGTSSGSYWTVADSSNGKYTSVFTGTASGTARTLSATINSSTVTSTMPSVTVTPGSFSLSQSTVSVGRTSIASGDTTLVTLIARDANGNRLTGGGLTVAFGLGAGTSSGTYGTVADSANGKYTSVFTGTASGTARTLSATINSSTVTSTMPSVTVTPGSFSLSQSTVSVGRTSIASGDTTLVTLIARDANGNRLTGGGLTVAFGLGAGTSSGTYGTVADSANGKYTSVFTGTASGTARTLSATINSSTVTSTMPSVTVTPGSFSLSQSTVSVGRTSIASGDTTLVTLIARDANGNRLTGGGLTVAFGLGAGTSSGTYGTVADSANGKYTSVFTGTASGTARTLSATINSSTVTSTMPSVTVTPGSFSLSQSTVSVGRTSIASGDTTLVTLIARDANGNRLTGGGLTVAFGLGSGTSSGSFSTVADSANGKYTSVFTGTASGTARTLSATINSSTVTSTMPSVTVTPGSFSLSQSTVSVGRTSIASGDTTLVTLIARDANGNRLTGGGLTVAFGLGAGTSSGTYGTVADSSNGKYTSVFTGTASGTARTLSATINSSTVTSTMPSVTVTPGSFSLSQSTVSVGRTSIASGDTTLVTLIARDANGNRLTGGGLTVAFGLGAGTSSGTYGTVADSSNGKYTSVFTGTASGTARTLSATINSSTVTSTMPSVTVTPGSFSLSQSTVSVGRTSIASGDTTLVTLIARDANGNRLTGGGLTVAFGLGAGTSSGTYGTVADSANGKYTSVFTGTASGTARTLSATINSSTVTSTMPSVTVTPGSFSLSQSTVSVGRTSIASGDTTLVTLIARDANGNRLTGGGLTVAFGLGAGTSSGTYGTVADSSNGKYTSVFTGTTSGTARTLSATINSSTVTSTMPSVTVTPGSFSLSQSTVSVGRTSIASGDTTLVTLIARDANGNRLTGGGLTVAFGLGAGTSSGTYGTVADSANGKYTSVFTGTASGTARTLSATINSSTVTSTMPSVTVTPGSFSLSQSTVSVGRTSIASGDTTLVTLIARDANGNRLTGGGLTVAFGLGAGTSSGTYGTVADSSNGKYTSVFTGTASGTARTLSATINSSTVTSTMPSVTVTPGSFSLSQSTVSVGRTSIASGDTTLVTLIARDANGNRLTGGGLTVAFGLGSGTSSGSFSTVADSSNGKYTSVFTGTTSGTARSLTAKINTLSVTSTMPSVTVTPGSFSLSQSTVGVARDTIASNDTTLVTLIARDANGNRLTGGGLTVAFGLGSGTSSGSFSTVADSSNGKYTSVFTGTTSGTARTLTATINSSTVTSTMPSVTVTFTTGVVQTGGIPKTFSLSQNYPNPFNPSTTIQFALPMRSTVRLEVFNIIGQRVAELVSEELAAGYYQKTWRWNGASGIYIYRIEATAIEGQGNSFVMVKKMIVLK